MVSNRHRKRVETTDEHSPPGDILILVCGVSGAGKSTFVNDVLDPNSEVKAPVCEKYGGSPAMPPTAYPMPLPQASTCQEHQKNRLVIVEASGFNGGGQSDDKILEDVKHWIERSYGGGTKFSGVIYLHDISEKRIRHGTPVTMARLKALCGENPETKMAIATTHWDSPGSDDELAQRETDLRATFWKDLTNAEQDAHTIRLRSGITKRRDTCCAIDVILRNTPHTPLPVPLPPKKTEKWKKNVHLNDTFLEDGRPDDLIITLMGSTGVGKSTLINEAVKLYGGRAADNSGREELGSDTPSVVHHKLRLPADHKYFPGRRLILVDTPGFDDAHRDNSEILRRIGVWLAGSYSGDTHLAGLVYLNDISLKRMLGSERLSVDVFRKMCGKDFSRIIMATSHWDAVEESTGSQREEELKQIYWKELIEQGAKVHRIERRPDDVVAIIEGILSMASTDARAQVLRIQAELVDMEKSIPSTKAGAKLRRSLRELAKLQKQQLENATADNDREKIEEEIAFVLQQIEQLTVPFPDRFKSWLRMAARTLHVI